MRLAKLGILGVVLWASTGAAAGLRGHLDTEDLPSYLRDRGEGIPLSSFGTYVQKGQLIVYPFFEYYRNNDAEYQPDELGFTQDTELRGKYTATEELLFIAYGVSDRLAFELEAAIIQAKIEKSPNDPTNPPSTFEEDGLGDVEGQLRWRWARESATRPEFFSYFETVAPTPGDNVFIGTSDWEFKLGSGLIRGFSWGTVTARGAVEYGLSEDKFELGELSLEYLRRLSNKVRIFTGFEGTQDEIELLTELQLHPARNVIVKLNNGFGLTSKATDWAPEVGVMFSLP